MPLPEPHSQAHWSEIFRKVQIRSSGKNKNEQNISSNSHASTLVHSIWWINRRFFLILNFSTLFLPKMILSTHCHGCHLDRQNLISEFDQIMRGLENSFPSGWGFQTHRLWLDEDPRSPCQRRWKMWGDFNWIH